MKLSIGNLLSITPSQGHTEQSQKLTEKKNVKPTIRKIRLTSNNKYNKYFGINYYWTTGQNHLYFEPKRSLKSFLTLCASFPSTSACMADA